MTARALAYVVYDKQLHVLGSADGRVAGLRPIATFTPDWEAVGEVTDRVRGILSLASDAGELCGASTDEVRSLCGFLFDELVPLSAKRWFDTPGGTLTLSLPEALLGIPWELLHNGSTYLGLGWAVGRTVQLGDDAMPSGPLPARPRALVVADPDGTLDEAYSEGVALRDGLRAGGRVGVTVRSSDVDAAYLRREVRRHDILHYAGHVDPRGWRMSASYFDAESVGRLTGGGALPSLVFANGCAAGGGMPPTENANGGSQAMLTAWLRGGTRHVVGPLHELPDSLGRRFALAFYDALNDGASVGESVRRARVRVAAESGEGTTPWAAYVLYGDPEFRYLPAPGSQDAVAEPAPPTPPTRLRDGRPEPATLRQSATAVAAPSTAGQGLAARTALDAAFAALCLVLLLLALAAIGAGVPTDGDAAFDRSHEATDAFASEAAFGEVAAPAAR